MLRGMGELIHLKGKRSFTLQEARRLLPVIIRLTSEAIQKTERVLLKMETFERGTEPRKLLEAKLNRMIEEWVYKIERLGCDAKGLWLVDFDSGSGCYCWQYGEDDIYYFHGYTEGFSGRRPLQATQLNA